MDTNMSNISICKVTNKENDEDLTVYTEWGDLKVKILIVNADKILEGEVLKKDFNPYAKTFEKSVEDYLKETQDILAGKNEDIDFVLKNEKFLWKRKKWSLGQVGMKPLLENSHVSSLFSNILNKFSQNVRNLIETKEKGKNDENTISELRAYNNDLIKKKEQLESMCYKRTILLVNSKKAKIRDLKKVIDKYESKNDPIFDVDTENSESETEATGGNISKSKRKVKYGTLESDKECGKKKTCDISVQTEALTIIDTNDTSHKQSKRKPRHSLERDDETVKKKRSDISVQTEYLVEESPMKNEDALASSSKTLQLPSNIGEDEETPDFLTDESDCEMELKLEDDKNQDTETQGNALTQEESSEELF